MSLFDEYPVVGPRGTAVIKHGRSPSDNDLGPPYGFADLPAAVGAEVVLAGGVMGDAAFRSSNGRHEVVQGEIRMTSGAERALRWDPSHPRDASAIAALRSPSPPWEIGWRVSAADWR